MLGGYFEFFMKPDLAETYMSLKRELEELIQQKVSMILSYGLMLKITLSSFYPPFDCQVSTCTCTCTETLSCAHADTLFLK